MGKSKTKVSSIQTTHELPTDTELLKMLDRIDALRGKVATDTEVHNMCEVFELDDYSEMDRIVAGKVGEVSTDQWG